jgi:hypothetical protein
MLSPLAREIKDWVGSPPFNEVGLLAIGFFVIASL